MKQMGKEDKNVLYRGGDAERREMMKEDINVDKQGREVEKMREEDTNVLYLEEIERMRKEYNAILRNNEKISELGKILEKRINELEKEKRLKKKKKKIRINY